MRNSALLRRESRHEKIELQNGLIMRWSTLGHFGTNTKEGEEPSKNEYIAAFVNWLMSGEHAVSSVYDFALVEDTALVAQPGKNPIVAVVALTHMSGYFGFINMPFGVVTAVGTLRGYRNRGLIKRLLLQMLHPAADERGDAIIFILGIPHFYRQFGYECAVPYRTGRAFRNISASIPSAPAENREPFTLREATSGDIPYLVTMSTPERIYSKAQLGTYYTTDVWRVIIDVHSPERAKSHHDVHHHANIIVDSKTRQDIGFLLTSHILGRWAWELFVIDEDLALYRDVLPSVLRQLKPGDRPRFESYNTKLNNNILPDETDMDKRQRGQFPPLQFMDLFVKLTDHHPVVKLLASQGKLDVAKNAYRMYTRIADLPMFVCKIASLLEDRLRNSALRGISATLQINFYKKIEGMSGKGLEIVFEEGILKRASNWEYKSAEDQFYEAREKRHVETQEPSTGSKTKDILRAHFAPLTFTRLVTGSMDVDELLRRDGENFVEGEEVKLMLEILFPKMEHFVDVDWW